MQVQFDRTRGRDAGRPIPYTHPANGDVEREAAAAAGFYQTGDMKVPKPQILTAANILDNRRSAGTVRIHRRLQKVEFEKTKQGRLL
jgi:site-specific DNA-methyltransferase (adenine-specific)